jgi:hypothetical protein
MAADDLRGVIDQMKLMQISIESLNPDPAQTIHAYREMRAAQQSAADGLVTATAALVGATKRLAWATWALVLLTAVMAASTVFELIAAR